MTRLEQLSRIELDPDVPFPPFPLWLRVPADWSRLDCHPSTWLRSAGDLIDTTFGGSRLPASERRSVLVFLEGLVADCQRAGAVFSLLTVGRRAAGGAASLGLHLAFANDGRAADIARVKDILPRTGTTEEISAACGPAVLHRERMTMVVPGTGDIVALTSLQIFVPLPGTTWTAVLSTACAHPELTEPLAALLRGVAESLRTTEQPSLSGPRDRDAAAHEPDLVPVEAPGGLGFERGFGTLVMHRLDPPVRSGPSAGRTPEVRQP